MISLSELARAQGRNAYDVKGEPLGTVEQIYMSDFGDDPRWVTVTGAPGSAAQLFAPVVGARVTDDGLRLAWSKDEVLASPQIDADEHIGPEAESRLSQHYGRDPSTSGGRHAAGHETGRDTEQDTEQVTEYDAAEGIERSAEGDDLRVTLREERAVTGTEQGTRRLRLRRYTVTEMETVEVPLKRERLAIERVSETDGTPQVIEEITLREERVAEVRTETVVVEDVQISKTLVEEDEEVAVQVEREYLDVEAPRGHLDSEGDETAR